MKARFSIVKFSFNNLVMIIEIKGNAQEAFFVCFFFHRGQVMRECGGNWSRRNLGHKLGGIS